MSSVPDGSTKVIIDISGSSDVIKVTDAAALIQQGVYDRVRSLINGFVASARDYDPGSETGTYRTRVHNTITISGSRGSGKTTLITNYLEKMPHDDVAALGVIDPTLIESKENIVVSIINLIVQKCEQHYGDARPRGMARLEDDRMALFKKLRKLAGGLCLLDGVGPDRMFGDDWSDPQHVFEIGLQNARSGADFEHDFKVYIHAALRFIGKRAFVLAFDDIDTQFERGWPVLETIRKYLTSPQLVVLLSGDMGLYSRLIRAAQFQNLGGALLQYDRPNRTHHHADRLPEWEQDRLVKIVDDLEDQYVRKILKPEHRVQLKTLAQMEAEVDIVASTLTGELGAKPRSLTAAMNEPFDRVLFLTDDAERKRYRMVVLEQPVRTVLQFLRAWLESASEQGRGEDLFVRRLSIVFASQCYRFGLDPSAISDGGADTLLDQFIRWNQDADIWETGYRLKPEYVNSDLNVMSLVFATRFSQLFAQSAFQILSYMIKIGLTRELMLLLPDPFNSRSIIDFLGLDLHERTTTVARRSVAMQRMLLPANGIVRGTIPIAGAKIDIAPMLRNLYLGQMSGRSTDQLQDEFIENSSKIDKYELNGPPICAWWSRVSADWAKVIELRKRRTWKGYVYNTLDSLRADFNGKPRLIHLAACILTGARGEDTTYLSVFNLLGAMAELLAIPESGAPTPEWVRSELVRLCQLRSYPRPLWSWSVDGSKAEPAVGRTEDAEGNDLEESAGPDIPSEELEGLVTHLVAWLESVQRMRFDLYPSIYARINTRLYYTLSRMDDELSASDLYTGYVLHRQIIAFLNAVLVEEMLARGRKRRPVADGKPGEPVLDNPTLSSQAFWLNFPGTPEQEGVPGGVDFDDLPLFRLMFSCPLIGLFIQPRVVVHRGNKMETWNLLDHQLRSWFPVADADMEARQAAVRVNRTDGVTGGTVTFRNLWAPLNSIPLLRGGLMTRPVWEAPTAAGSAPAGGGARRGGRRGATLPRASISEGVLVNEPDPDPEKPAP